MYSLDINFLSDREIRPIATTTGTAPATPGDRGPLVLGLVVAVVALAAVGGYWLVLQQQLQRLGAREQQLDSDIAAIQSQLQEISNIRAQIDIVRAENMAFANVFNRIRPWSALLQEIRDRTPARIRIVTMRQTAGTGGGEAAAPEAAAPVEGEATPTPTGGVEIIGTACSFDDVNDFVLVLQQSPLLTSNTVAIGQSQRQLEFLDPTTDGSCPGTPAGTLTALVDFTIRADMTTTPANELLEVLDRQGAVGLATRIRAIRDAGIGTTP
ncbi:PilN domain-containing protein [Leptolyngbya sp. PCC 6406]|uniref:PilN domain-containing protein n=1 Tax=Leptolyngbya sp. PCC 6406 TaxID=1173264 RepID=UPI0002ACB29F|nr:PilN domain-containing protein [Leptolyngbya sp. PCC 6406]